MWEKYYFTHQVVMGEEHSDILDTGIATIRTTYWTAYGEGLAANAVKSQLALGVAVKKDHIGASPRSD